MSISLPDFPQFDTERESGTTALRWDKYVKRFENLCLAFNITAEKRKRALLLHYSGETVQDILDSLPDTGDDYNTAKNKLTEHFSPKKNTSYEIYKFRQLTQLQHESLSDFYIRLKNAAQFCEFGENTDKEIKSQIELGTTSKKLRRYAFRNIDVTLAALLEYGRILEDTETYAQKIETASPAPFTPQPADVQQINTTQNRGSNTTSRPPPRKTNRDAAPRKSNSKTTDCYRCGLQYPHPEDRPCPAEGKSCNYCGTLNHFARVCFKKKRDQDTAPQQSAVPSRPTPTPHNRQIHQLDNDSDSSDEYIYPIYTETDPASTVNKIDFTLTVQIADQPVDVIIDSGSCVNILDAKTFDSLFAHKHKLRPSKRKLFAYGTTNPLDIKGTSETTIETPSKITVANFYIITNGKGAEKQPLL